VAPAYRSCVPEWGSPLQINLMDEGESEHGLIYLSSHEIRSLQYVVKADGGAVSLPGHAVLRQQESPSLDRSERSHGNTPLRSSCKRFNQIQLSTICYPRHVRGALPHTLRIRYLFAFPQAAVLRCRYAFIHAFIQSPKGTPLVHCKDCGVSVPCDAREWPSLPVVVICPACGSKRAYRPSEVFLGTPLQIWKRA
jgi:hypothetical protein